jgi:predicted nucleic acid-binding protein
VSPDQKRGSHHVDRIKGSFHLDLIIAATAHAHGARLIAANVTDFDQLSGVLDVVEF